MRSIYRKICNAKSEPKSCTYFLYFVQKEIYPSLHDSSSLFFSHANVERKKSSAKKNRISNNRLINL